MKRLQTHDLYAAEPLDDDRAHLLTTRHYDRADAGAQRRARQGIPTALVQIEPSGRRREIARYPPKEPRRGILRRLFPRPDRAPR